MTFSISLTKTEMCGRGGPIGRVARGGAIIRSIFSLKVVNPNPRLKSSAVTSLAIADLLRAEWRYEIAALRGQDGKCGPPVAFASSATASARSFPTSNHNRAAVLIENTELPLTIRLQKT